MRTHRILAALAAAPLALCSTTALAAEEEEEAAGPIEIDAEVAVLSDYRFRGISLSGKDPEVTAEVSITHESGLYASAWVSNVDLSGEADNVEIDLTAGYSVEAGAITFDAGAIYYLYPNYSDFNYIEFYGSVSTAVGPGTLTLGAAYAPSQNNLGDTDNTYVYLSGEVPIGDSPWSLHGTVGFEDGAFGDNKKDWLAGISYDLGSGITATVDYVDTADARTSLGDATVVASIAFAF